MQTLYLDAFSGISGDMFLGALLDLGLDFEQLKTELAKLHVHGYELTQQREAQSSIYGTSFDVQVAGGKDHGFVEHHHHDHEAGHHHDHEARHLDDIEALIDGSDLSDTVKHHAKAIFMEIAQAEAVVHHMPLAEVHFHEVGALDSIVDIVGCCIGLELMQIDTIMASPLSDGSGFINVAHGQMPVPVPAVMQMRVGSAIPIQQRLDVHTELITPTGMGLVKTLVREFGPLPENAVPTRIGYGFGKRDDQTGEGLGYVMNQLLTAGAYDVFFTPIQMKKDRPATKLTVLGNVNDKDLLTKLILQETTTIGVRYQTWQRTIMQRHFLTVATPYGDVQVKVATYQDIEKKMPEYADCAQLAQQFHIPFRTVYQAALVAVDQLDEEA